MGEWPRIALGEILQRSNETAVLNPDQEYSEITIKLWGKGVVSRGKVSGSSVVTTRRFVRTNQLVLSKIDARHGAIGLVPPELDGAIVTNDFPSFLVCENRIKPEFLGWLVRFSGFVEVCRAASEGTTNRVRIQEDRFLKQKIGLPPIDEQHAIVTQLDAIAEKARQVEALLDEIDVELNALCRGMIFSQKNRRPNFVPMRDLLSMRSPDVRVDRDKTYHFAGVYSFGRGLFKSVTKAGTDFSYEWLSTLREGDFTYPKLMAWEGALGVVPPECEELVVSPEFPVFNVNNDIILPDILDLYFKTPQVWSELAEISSGTNQRRRRLQPSAFLNYEMPVPSMPDQYRLQKIIKRKNETIKRHTETRKALKALMPSMLEKSFA